MGLIRRSGIDERDEAANWTADNPILLDGQRGWEIGTNQLKIGDGVTAWNSLPYWGGTGGGTVTSVSGTANRITSTGGTTPVIDIAATYVGQASITTLGTITTGTWNATVISPTYGGTGVNNGTNALTIPATGTAILGGGAATRVAYFSDANTLTSSTTFLNTGSTLIYGGTTVIATEFASFQRNSNSDSFILVSNTDSGTAAKAFYLSTNGTVNFGFGITGTGATGGGIFGTPSLGYISGGGANGVAIGVSNASGGVRIYTGGIAAANLKTTISAAGNFTHTHATQTSASAITLFTGATVTNQTASTELISFNLNYAATVTFATGTISTQRAFLFTAPTYAAAGASTITTASGLQVIAPVAGTNVTFTNSNAAHFINNATSGSTGIIVANNPNSTTIDTVNPTIVMNNQQTAANTICKINAAVGNSMGYLFWQRRSSGGAGANFGISVKTNNLTTYYPIYCQGNESSTIVLTGIGNNTSPTALMHFAAGTTAANTAPIKLTTSGAGVTGLMTTAEKGAIEMTDYGLWFSPSASTRHKVIHGLVGAAAPATNTIGTIADYYGTSATRVLTTPNTWISVVGDDGNTYKIPAYS